MFDLFRSREKSVRIVLGGILLLVALSMLSYLVPSYNPGGVSNEAVVATVGDQEITTQDIRKLIQSTMKGRELPPEVLPNYIPKLIDQMVSDRALEYEAKRLGFQVTDQDLANTIRQITASQNLFPDGKFNKEVYAMFLAQNDMNIQDFEADVRRRILISRLRDVAVEGTVVSELEIAQTYKARNDKIKLQYVKLTSDKYTKEVDPSLDEQKTFFNANRGNYTVPAKKNLAVLYLDPAKLEQSLNPTDAELRDAYKKNIAQYQVAERVKAGHILLMTQGKAASEEPKIKALADDILKQVRSGANFADLVEKYSEDPGSKKNVPGREAGLGPGEYYVERNGQMVKEFENAAYSMKQGESSVIKTTYGYHVVKIGEHIPAHVKTFDDVKGDLATQWKKQRANAILTTASDKGEVDLKADPTHPDKVAAELNMQVIRADNWEKGQKIGDLEPNQDLDKAASELKVGQSSQAIALPNNKLALAVVTGETPARPKTFEEAQSDIHAFMLQARLNPALQKHARELYDRARETGDLEKAAKSMGLEVKTSEEFNRTATTLKDLDGANYFNAVGAFTVPEGTVIGPVPLMAGTVVAKVIAKIPADMSNLVSQRALIRDDIKKQRANDRNNLFESGVVTTLERQGKLKKNKEVIDRLVAAYRG